MRAIVDQPKTLKDGMYEEWLRHCANVFGDKFASVDEAVSFFRAHFEDDPFASVDGIIVIQRGDCAIAASARLTRRCFRWASGGRDVEMGGICDVATAAPFRGQGLASQLVKHIISTWQMPIALHASGEAPQRLYASMGFKSLPFTQCSVSLREMTTSVVDISFVPVDWSVQGFALKGIHESFACHFDGHILRRHPLYWEKWIMRAWGAPGTFTRVVLREGQVHGLISLRQSKLHGEGYLQVVDFFISRPKDGASLLAKLRDHVSVDFVELPSSVCKFCSLVVSGSSWTDSGWMFRGGEASFDPELFCIWKVDHF